MFYTRELLFFFSIFFPPSPSTLSHNRIMWTCAFSDFAITIFLIILFSSFFLNPVSFHSLFSEYFTLNDLQEDKNRRKKEKKIPLMMKMVKTRVKCCCFYRISFFGVIFYFPCVRACLSYLSVAIEYGVPLRLRLLKSM